MDDDGEDLWDLPQTMEFTHEDFSELNDIINLTATSNIEKISEMYKSFSYTTDFGGDIENEMTKVDNVESNGLKSLLTENFSTREELLDRVRKVGLMEGYVTTIRRSKLGRNVVIGCDRGGKYRARGTSVSMDERKKISASRLIDCPFKIKGKKKIGESWKVEIKNASHNHGLSSDMSGHPYCRRFSQEDMLSIRQMTLAGIPPRQVLSSLRLSDPSCKAIARTVYNAKNAITKEVLAGRTMVQALFDELAWHLLEVQYKEKEYVINYLKNTWLPFKERFVNAWIGKHPHFGHCVTSRVEGAHSTLKRYLTVSTGNFREVREKICLAIENQYNEIKTKIASEKLRVIRKFQIPMLKELVSHVSFFALGELFKQCELARTDYVLGPCTGHFSRTMGLLCAHMMRDKKDGTLLLDDIHPQWRIDRSFTDMDGGVNTNGSEIESLLKRFHDKYKQMPLAQKEDSQRRIAELVDGEIPLTLEPNIQPHKGRPLGSKKRKGDSSTTRHPSAFEIAEKTRGDIENEMTKVDNVESNGLKSLLTENFSTREELLDRVRKVGLMEGYVTTIRRSKLGRNVVIGCDRGGKYRARGTSVSMDERKKISASRLIDCPFKIKGKKKIGESWKVEIKNASHNHGLSSDMSGHPYCRRFSQEDMLSIRQMTLAGIPPRQVLSSLRLSDPSCKAIARTVYNAKNAITKEVLAGRTMVQALFDELAWHLLEVQYKEKEYVINYLKNTWLPFKERFVNAWIGKHPHFGHRVTSRVEGAHSTLKRYLTVSTGNFREVREKICLAIENQYNEIKTKIASEKLRVIRKFQIPMLKELVSHVSFFALGELFKQCELARTDYVLGPCTGHFSRTMGLLCAHMMRDKKDGTLLLDDIHPQWRIDRSFTDMDGGVNTNGSEIESLLKRFHDKYKQMPLAQKEDSQRRIAELVDGEIPLTLEPNIQPHKGRPLGSKKRKGDSSTTRHPSAFEIAEKTRKCSVCHRVGHNSRTCPHKDKSSSSDPHFVLANQDVSLNMLETPSQYEINTSLQL
ncbi:hypothetical protein RHSIM_Rhsim04G0198300 [Rhododendron simsii]|uniref:Protein FAR1-RELATED SEQUENCE n=1 Tax=Rhododendron simsii TaxID=118357 RepID=A0A834LQA1_RHOSS|nr:hypothetical protein RHSIM_Rhsim04G0198300 [Rhododendron simsii]